MKNDAIKIAQSTVDFPEEWPMLRDNTIDEEYPHLKQVCWQLYIENTNFK